MSSKADEGHGGVLSRRWQRNRAPRSQCPENRRLKDNIKHTGNVIRTRTARAASDIETRRPTRPHSSRPKSSLLALLDSAPLTPQTLGISGLRHCTARSHARPSHSDNQPQSQARGLESHSAVATADRTSRSQRKNYCEASRLARFQYTSRNRSRDSLEAEP